MIKLFVALPAYGLATVSHTAVSLFRLGQALADAKVPAAIGTMSMIDIVEARNVFLTVFMDRTDATHLLFVDADNDFPADLIKAMIARDHPLVGTVYPARVFPPKFVGRCIGEAPHDVDDGFIKVDGVGAGIMLIRRDCVERLLEADPSLSVKPNRGHAGAALIEQMKLERIISAFNRVEVDGETRAEDLSFCYRWRSLGEDIWANISYEIGHTGPHTYRSRYLEVATGAPPPQSHG